MSSRALDSGTSKPTVVLLKLSFGALIPIWVLEEVHSTGSQSILAITNAGAKSNEFRRIRYNQDDRGNGRGNGRGDRWGGYFIFLGNLIQIQVYFQHLVKISRRCNMSHSFLSIQKVIFKSE